MSARIFYAATPTSGIRHRMLMLSWIKHFADSRGYNVVMLWGVTGGVSFCRFEELLSPIPGVTVRNVSSQQLDEIVRNSMKKRCVRVGSESFRVFRSTKAASPLGPIPELRTTALDHPNTWELLDVPGREAVLIHNGNAAEEDSKGCILVGDRFGVIDGFPAVLNSVATLNILRGKFSPNFTLTIS